MLRFSNSDKEKIAGLKITMAMARRWFGVFLSLGLALHSCMAKSSPAPDLGAPGRHPRAAVRLGGHHRAGVLPNSRAVFDVRKYGAVADDSTDNFEAFMAAWVAACNCTQPAKVVVPPGTFMTGPVVFQGPCKGPKPIHVVIKGIVKASTDISSFPTPEWFMFEYIDGLVLSGGGVFDGQGQAVWEYNDCGHNSKCQLLPTSLKFNHVNNSIVHGITSVNSKGFHMFVTMSQNFTAHQLNLTAPCDSPNTDGIHISTSNLVKIYNNHISTGDDCISVGQGSTAVTINKIFCGPGHGISIGSLGKYKDEKDVNGVVVSNCTLFNTTNGVRIKTWGGSPPSQATGIIFDDIVLDMVKNPIIIDQMYGSKKKQPSLVKISNVHFKNIRGTSVSNDAVTLQCSSAVPCLDVELFNIDLAYKGKSLTNATVVASCLNAKVRPLGKQNPPPCL